MLIVDLPLPPRQVAANAAGSWHGKARAKAEQRQVAKTAGLATLERVEGHEPLAAFEVEYRFRFHTRRKRDLDNLVFSMKSSLDGLGDAGLFVDDCGLVALHVRAEVVEKTQPSGVEVRLLPVSTETMNQDQ